MLYAKYYLELLLDLKVQSLPLQHDFWQLQIIGFLSGLNGFQDVFQKQTKGLLQGLLKLDVIVDYILLSADKKKKLSRIFARLLNTAVKPVTV